MAARFPRGMVQKQVQEIAYSHPFSAVTASLWSKYDNHKNVKEVDVLDRHVDAEGKLHSTRLLTIRGNLPTIFKPFVPVSSVYMLEEVIVDPETQSMRVHTRNINLRSVVEASSHSDYQPAPYARDHTMYTISILVRAFPNKYKLRSGARDEADGEESHKVGYIAGRLEKWAAGKLLGNVSKGQRFVDAFCRQQRTALCQDAASS